MPVKGSLHGRHEERETAEKRRERARRGITRGGGRLPKRTAKRGIIIGNVPAERERSGESVTKDRNELDAPSGAREARSKRD